MKLIDYINSHPRSQRRAARQRIAQFSGVSESAVRHWANGIRAVPSGQLTKVERATGGLVTRHELRPDLSDLFAPIPPAEKHPEISIKNVTCVTR